MNLETGKRYEVPFGGLGCMIFSGLFLVGLFYFLSWLYFKLWYAAPVFLVLALIVNWRVVTSSIKGAFTLLVRKPISGVFSLVLAGLLFPFITLGWLLAALGFKQHKRMQQQFGNTWGFGAFDPAQVKSSRDTEYVEFEELDSKQLPK